MPCCGFLEKGFHRTKIKNQISFKMRLQAGLTKLTAVAPFTAKEFLWAQHTTGLIAVLRRFSCFTAYMLRAASHSVTQTQQPGPTHRPPHMAAAPTRFPRTPLPELSTQEHAPMSSANPPTGRRQVPVTNCNSRILFSLSISLTTYDENVAGEWDPRHPQTCSPAGPGAPSCSTAPATDTPCPPGSDTARGSAAHEARGPALASSPASSGTRSSSAQPCPPPETFLTPLSPGQTGAAPPELAQRYYMSPPPVILPKSSSYC